MIDINAPIFHVRLRPGAVKPAFWVKTMRIWKQILIVMNAVAGDREGCTRWYEILVVYKVVACYAGETGRHAIRETEACDKLSE